MLGFQKSSSIVSSPAAFFFFSSLFFFLKHHRLYIKSNCEWSPTKQLPLLIWALEINTLSRKDVEFSIARPCCPLKPFLRKCIYSTQMFFFSFTFHPHLAPRSHITPLRITMCLCSVCAFVSDTMWNMWRTSVRYPDIMCLSKRRRNPLGLAAVHDLPWKVLVYSITHTAASGTTVIISYWFKASKCQNLSIHGLPLALHTCVYLVCVLAKTKKKINQKQGCSLWKANMQSWLLLLVSSWKLWCFIIETKDLNTQPVRFLLQHFPIPRGKFTPSYGCFHEGIRARMNRFICRMLKVPYCKIFTSPTFSEGHQHVSEGGFQTFYQWGKTSIN